MTPSYHLMRNTYYLQLNFNRKVFADEWAKRQMLDAFTAEKSGTDICVYAFCILDDTFRLALAADHSEFTAVKQFIRRSLARFGRTAELLPGDEECLRPEYTQHLQACRITRAAELLSVIRYIHLIPSTEFCCMTAFDYWWTSFSEYRQRYHWPLLSIDPVLSMIGAGDPSKLQEFIETHRRLERAGNPVPSCLLMKASAA